MNSPESSSTRGVRCPRHGLWFDATRTTQCSRCETERAPRSTYVPWGLLFVLALVVGVAVVAWRRRAPSVEVIATSELRSPAVATPAPDSSSGGTEEPRTSSVREIGYQVDGSARRALVYGEAWPDARPLVLAADPGGRHDASMQRLLPGARALRWIVATTPVVRNGSPDTQDTRELNALRLQVEQLFRVDRKRIVVEGWSGTGCGAYAQVLMNDSLYRGAIVENAHMGPWREYGKLAAPGKLVYLFTRTNDFNAPHTRALRDSMIAAGYTVHYDELPGAHVPLMPDEMLRAMQWMDHRL